VKGTRVNFEDESALSSEGGSLTADNQRPQTFVHQQLLCENNILLRSSHDEQVICLFVLINMGCCLHSFVIHVH